MSYIVEQRIGKHIYLYEVQSYWDSFKKQPRQKRRYIGKKDPTTGEAIPPERRLIPRSVRDFGHVYLLKSISKQIGLTDILRRVFPSLAELLLELICFQITESNSLYLFKSYVGSTYTEVNPKDASSQRLSELLEALGKAEREREMFFRMWFKEIEDIRAVVFDITSFSSYSKINDFLEWGYNRDGEMLQQVNFGVVFAEPSSVAVAYRVYPGSIPDVKVLSGVIEFLKEIGFKEFLFVLDKGFYSKRNLEEMIENGISFIIPAPFTSKEVVELISRRKRDIELPSNAISVNGKILFHVEGGISLGGKRLYAHIYYDGRRKAEGVESFIRRLTEIEDKVRGCSFRSRQEAERYIEELWKGVSKFFFIKMTEEGVEIKRKDKEIMGVMERMGYRVLVTDVRDKGAEEIIHLLRRKDSVEKLFDVLKNELRENRLRVSSRDSMEGRLFLSFLSLIVYGALIGRMKEGGLIKGYTVKEVLNELKKIRVVEMASGKRYLTEISKKQRDIFESLKVNIPVKT